MTGRASSSAGSRRRSRRRGGRARASETKTGPVLPPAPLRVPAGVLRPRSVPNQAPVEASSNWFLDFGSNRSKLREVPLRFLRPKAPVPPDSGKSGFGLGFPRLLALLSRLPHHCFYCFRPEGHPPHPRWRHSEAFVRFRAAAPDREMPICRADSIRGSANCLWITRITGIESRPQDRRRRWQKHGFCCTLRPSVSRRT